MNTYLIIGLILVLVGVLFYSRRKRAADAADDITAAAVPAPAPSPTLAPASQAPLPRPAAPRDDIAPAPVHAPPPPSNWIPEETIVEPGWPLPGEISGNWSPVTTHDGAAGAVREEASPATAVVDPPAPAPEPAPVTAPVAAADEWLMPVSPDVAWPAPAEETPVALATAPPEPAFAAESAATTWDPPLAEMDTPVWTPPPSPTWPVAEPEAASVAVAEPEDAPPAPEPPAPVVWNLDPPAPAPVAVPESAPVAEVAPPPPAIAEWIAPLPEVVPEPVEVVPEPVEALPEPEIDIPAATEPADIRDQSLAVADLAPLLGGLLPLTRVSDRTGVTPRMLALMRALADGPLSVSEQARRLEVSRPVVADLSARLESQGLARRERDAADRRRVRIALTERGRRVCDEAPVTDPAAIEAALARMEPAERDGLLRGVRALERVAAAR
jgi:DNA-binding MarR family transcriptional regulator